MAVAVASELDRLGQSKRWLADRSGIAYSTLRRKMQASTDFTVTELAAIAAALELSPSVLVPSPRVTDASP